VLHDFTSDPRRLVRVLSRHLGIQSPELDASDTTVPEYIKTGDPIFDAETEAFLKKTTELVSGEYIRRRIEATTGALEVIANHLSGVRGRKNLVWVSSGFPIDFNAGFGLETGTADVSRAVRAINDANVAVYPVDARGLAGAFVNPAARVQVANTLATVNPAIETMQTLAEETGGWAFFNTNAIGEAIRRAVDDSRLSYVLGYYPSHGRWDGRFQEVKVKVRRSGLQVRHRKGYLALPVKTAQNLTTRDQAILDAIRSPLEATGIGLTAHITVEPLSNEAAFNIKVDPGSVTLDKQEDLWVGAIDVTISQLSPDGRIFHYIDTTVDLSFNDQKRDQLMREGFALIYHTGLRTRDEDRLAIVVRDIPTQSTGSVVLRASEIPNR
jgi:VWFA-related protein